MRKVVSRMNLREEVERYFKLLIFDIFHNFISRILFLVYLDFLFCLQRFIYIYIQPILVYISLFTFAPFTKLWSSEFLIKWVGYNKANWTWEPRKNIPEVILRYVNFYLSPKTVKPLVHVRLLVYINMMHVYSIDIRTYLDLM